MVERIVRGENPTASTIACNPCGAPRDGLSFTAGSRVRIPCTLQRGESVAFRGFESISLHRRVWYEPDFLALEGGAS